MKITADNYEYWALDYLEGMLSQADRDAFERYLATDPQAAQQIRALEEYMPVVPPCDEITCPESSTLMRPRHMTPLRRLGLLASGAAAAAVFVGALVWLGPSRPSAPLAENYSRSPIATPIIEQRAIATEPEASRPESVPVTEATASMAGSRLSEWNRKTTQALARMQARRSRPRTEAVRTPSAEDISIDRDRLMATVGVGRPAAAVSAKFDSASSLSLPALAQEGLLPPDATEPIFAAYLQREEVVARETDLSGYREEHPRRRNNLLRSLLTSIEKISPIKYYEDEEGRGVEIMSSIRIGNKNN